MAATAEIAPVIILMSRPWPGPGFSLLGTVQLLSRQGGQGGRFARNDKLLRLFTSSLYIPDSQKWHFFSRFVTFITNNEGFVFCVIVANCLETR